MLTNAAAKAAGAQARAYKLHDTGGLFLFVAPTGTKSWRLKYRWQGREKLLTIGRLPETSLQLARARREEAKEQLRNGRDPGARVDMKVNSFAQLARAWYRHNRESWSPAHAADVLASLERDIFPAIGRLPAASIDAPCLLAAMREVEERGCVATARRIRQRLSAIFGFGIAQGLLESDPAQHLGRAMAKGRPPRPMPALTQVESCRALLEACENVASRESTRLASRFLALTAVRLDAVRGMRWGELEGIKGDSPVWRVPPARMKLARAKKEDDRFAHLVPLSAQALAVLEQARKVLLINTQTVVDNKIGCDARSLVFPGRVPDQPIGEGAIRELYQRAGFAGRHVPHGWRSSFSTIMNEALGPQWRADIDRALAHVPKDKVEAAYNRAELLGRRRQIFARWGEMLVSKNGGN